MRRTPILGFLGMVGLATPALAEPVKQTSPQQQLPPHAAMVPVALEAPPTLVNSHTLFLNNCRPNGCMITRDTSGDNSRTNHSQIAPHSGTLMALKASVNFDVIKSCMASALAPFNITVTDVDPGSVPHFEIIIAGSPTELGFDAGFEGVAPYLCGGSPGQCFGTYIPNAITFAFANAYPDINLMCGVGLQESAHGWTLDHATSASDPMTYKTYALPLTFRDAAPCGSDCLYGTNMNQNAFGVQCAGTGLNGMPQLQTSTAAMVLQASLQHVVLTYDPVNGRQIIVDGVSTGTADPQKGGTIGNWDDTFALVLGNDVSGDRPWQGLIKFVAIHNRALTVAQAMQNYNAGVGQRFYLLFNVAATTGVSKGYVMFTASQYDNSSYLFTSPTFMSLDPAAKPDGIVIKGIRIGINGTIPTVGQAYIPLNTTVTATKYTAQGELLSSVGTVIAIQSGPLTDQFFLSFDVLGSKTHVTTDPVPLPIAPVDLPPVAGIGVRTFGQINSSLSKLTGVPTTNAAVMQTYTAVQQQLPSDPTLESFSSANQVGVAQMAIQYCNAAVNSSAAAQLFPGVTFNSSLYGATGNNVAGVSSVTNALAARVLATGLTTQPTAVSVTTELNKLIGKLCTSSACTTLPRVLAVTKILVSVALGNTLRAAWRASLRRSVLSGSVANFAVSFSASST